MPPYIGKTPIQGDDHPPFLGRCPSYQRVFTAVQALIGNRHYIVS
jgi:hypothetical protein